MSKLEVGKLPNELLEKIVIGQIKNQREEVIVGSSIGEDTAILDFDSDYIVVSADPITGATNNVGKLAVHISVNDVATKGADPVGILFIVLMPAGTEAEDIELIMRQAQEECTKVNMDIIGGHTEITDAVNKPVVITTVLGRVHKSQLPNPKYIKPGHIVAMTKSAALEGTAILANDLEDKLSDKLTPEELETAKALTEKVSVLEEGRITHNVNIGYMHDITEGGVLGAIWEAAKATGFGMEIDYNAIPIHDVTRKMADILDFNPLELISSGSMLIILSPEGFETMKKDLNKKDITLTAIGKITEGKTPYLVVDGEKKAIGSPKVDALYALI